MSLAFEQTRGVLYGQQGVAAAIDGKITFFFGLATAILGIGAPFVLQKPNSATGAMILAIACYAFVSLYSFWALRSKRLVTSDNPVLLEKLKDLPENELAEIIWKETNLAFCSNDGVLQMKAQCANRVFIFLIAQVLVTTFWAYSVFSAASLRTGSS